MRFKCFRHTMQLTSTLTLLCLLLFITRLCNAGRLPDNPGVFEMSVDEDDAGLMMNGDKAEQALFKQYQEQEFQKFQKEKGQTDEHKKKERKEAEEKEKEELERKEEEEEKKRVEQQKKERELRREKQRLEEEKAEKEEHERRQKELKEIERKRKQKEEEEKEEKMKEQREHNKQWRDKHEGRKKSKSKQEQWQQQQAEQAEEARKKFQQDNFQDETQHKKIEEAEAAELRILEPHVDTHTKEQKEEIKEREEHHEVAIDLLNPDAVLHAGEDPVEKKEEKKPEGHEHGEEDDEDCEECKKEKAEKEAAELKAKLAQEAQELSVLEPHVDTHNKVDKKVEEMMKDKPFIAGDIEAAVHGGGHVHEGEEGAEGPEGHANVGIKGMDELLETGRNKEEKPEIGAEDPEHLMHGGGNHDHGHKDPKDIPGLAVPGDVKDHGGDFAHDDSPAAKKKRPKPEDKEGPGIGIEDVEKAVHGAAQPHDHANDHKRGPGKIITKEDIEKLGLSKEMLKGVDLTKLLAKDQRQYERYQAGEDDDDDDDDEENKNSFWGQMSRIRKEYLDSLAARIRNIGKPDMENAEWDKNDLDDREMPTADKTGELHKGETALEHQMENWSSTAGKGRAGTVNSKFAPKVGEIPS